MKIITINIPDIYVEIFDILKEIGTYPSRSEAIRHAIRDFFDAEFRRVITLQETFETYDKTKFVKIPGVIELKKIIRRLE